MTIPVWAAVAGVYALHLGIAYVTTAVAVGFKALQQLNVHHRRYSWLWGTSMAMAVTDYYIVHMYVSNGPYIIIASGLGGASGCALSMMFDTKWRNRGTKESLRNRQSTEPAGSLDCVGHP